MSSPDTLNSIITSIDKMSEMQYVFLLFKLGSILVVALTGICGAAAAGYKAFTVFWGMVMRHIQVSLADSFATPSQLKEALAAFAESNRLSLETFQEISQAGFKTVLDRLAQGDLRMASIENRCWGRRRGEIGAICVSPVDPQFPHSEPESVHVG